MPDEEVVVIGKKFSGNTQIVLNIKAIITIVSLLIVIGSSVFTIVNTKLNKANESINKLEEKVVTYNTVVTTVQSQNKIILLYYGIDLGVEAEEASLARRTASDSPPTLPGQ